MFLDPFESHKSLAIVNNLIVPREITSLRFQSRLNIKTVALRHSVLFFVKERNVFEMTKNNYFISVTVYVENNFSGHIEFGGHKKILGHCP